MSSYFPKHIVEKYEPFNRYQDLYECYGKSITDMKSDNIFKEKTVALLWMNKDVHRDNKLEENDDKLIVTYKGQYSSSKYDKLFAEIQVKNVDAYLFCKTSKDNKDNKVKHVKDITLYYSYSHKCYEIVELKRISERISKKKGCKHLPPEYQLTLQTIDKNDRIENEYDDYYSNLRLHEARIKMKSMADYGFVPKSVSKITEGVISNVYKCLP